jgi:hypothetical protein
MSRTSQVWSELFVPLRVPKRFNLRTGPFEDADTTSNTYWNWMTDRAFLMVPAPGHRGGIFSHVPGVSTRQKAASFTVDQVMEKLLEGIGST